jgi:hypothetical protein
LEIKRAVAKAGELSIKWSEADGWSSLTHYVSDTSLQYVKDEVSYYTTFAASLFLCVLHAQNGCYDLMNVLPRVRGR